MPDSGLSSVSIVTLVAGSSVLAAVVTQGLGELRERLRFSRDGAFAALYLAVALESYADACSNLITDSENYSASDGHAGTARGNLDDLPPYSEEVDWKAFGISSTTEALSFRVEVESTQSMIRGHWEFGEEEDVVPVVREEAASLGLKALNLAAGFRRKWKIAPVIYDGNWNVRSFLEGRLARYLEERRLREERNAQLTAELFGTLSSETLRSPE